VSWRAVARRDLRELSEPRLVRWALLGLAGVLGLGGYLFPVLAGPPPAPMGDFPGFMAGSVTIFVPLVAVLVGYKAVVGERDSGELALTLSLPHTRRDVVLGKLATRAGLVAAAVLAGLLLAAVLVIYPYGTVEPLTYLGYLAVTLLFGLAFCCLAVGVSAVAPGERVATVVAFGLFALFVVLWDLVGEALAVGLDAIGLTSGSLPDWAVFLLGAEPVSAYERVVGAFWGGAGPNLADAPWYLSGWIALLLLLAWATVPLGLGYYRFREADL
jgi:ABC-2 type transport system permease protein